MSYYLVKNLKVNEKTGVVSGEFASNNVYDEYGRHDYRYNEDIYQNEKGTLTPLQKYSRFICDIVSGAIQGSIGKYNKLSIKNFYKDVYYFESEFPNEDPFILAYKKYKKEIEKQLHEKKEYIIKLDGNTYLQKLNTKTYRTTCDEAKAQVFGKNDFSTLKRCFTNPTAININSKKEINLENYEDIQISSEYELKYDLKIPVIGKNKTFKEISEELKNLENTVDLLNKKEIEIDEIKKIYQEQLNKILNNFLPKEKAIFSFEEKSKEGLPNIITIIYPELKETKENSGKVDYYMGYKFKCIDFCKSLEQEYDNNGMSISYILNNEEKTKEIAFNIQKKFENDILQFEKSEEDEEDLEP